MPCPDLIPADGILLFCACYSVDRGREKPPGFQEHGTTPKLTQERREGGQGRHAGPGLRTGYGLYAPAKRKRIPTAAENAMKATG